MPSTHNTLDSAAHPLILATQRPVSSGRAVVPYLPPGHNGTAHTTPPYFNRQQSRSPRHLLYSDASIRNSSSSSNRHPCHNEIASTFQSPGLLARPGILLPRCQHQEELLILHPPPRHGRVKGRGVELVPSPLAGGASPQQRLGSLQAAAGAGSRGEEGGGIKPEAPRRKRTMAAFREQARG